MKDCIRQVFLRRYIVDQESGDPAPMGPRGARSKRSGYRACSVTMVRADWYNDAPKVSEQRATTNAYFLVNLDLRQNTIILQAP